MSRIYSAQLFSQVFPLAGTTDITVGTAGQVVVIRSMDFFQSFPSRLMLQGFLVRMPSGANLWGVELGEAVSFHPYQWRGRQVFAGGDALEVVTNDAEWHGSASGYILSP